MAGQARDLPMRTEGENSVIITACACLVQFTLLAQALSEQHHSVQYPRDDIGAKVVGQAFSSAPPRSNTDQSGHAFLWSAKVVVAGTR